MSRTIDKRKGAKRKIIGEKGVFAYSKSSSYAQDKWTLDQVGKKAYYTKPSSSEAIKLDGSYAGFQPKPAVEVILIAMKPLSKNTYVDQALANEKGITWLDDCRIPHKDNNLKRVFKQSNNSPHPNDHKTFGDGNLGSYRKERLDWKRGGRFPANLLVSQDILDDGTISHSNGGEANTEKGATNIYNFGSGIYKSGNHYEDSGGFSRYFNVDKWFKKAIKRLPKDVLKTYPFLIVPKASKSEKNKGCEELKENTHSKKHYASGRLNDLRMKNEQKRLPNRNNHPTVKPIKLMSYLITLGSRQDDIILDPFIGSGTTAIAARILSRKFIGFEKEAEYHRIAEARIKPFMSQTKLGAGEFEQTTNCMSEM